MLAREYGLGLEVTEFSYAANMDTDFPHWDDLTRKNLAGIKRRIFHAPFNELCPAAIDPLVAEITRQRLEQAYKLACRYGINKMVVHSGYIPHIYVESWFAERSALFWRDFLRNKPPDFSLLLENVMEEKPDVLQSIVEQTDDARFKLCLDIGHAGGVLSKIPVAHWIEATAPYLGHVHIHNNYHAEDSHNPPGSGLIEMSAALSRIMELQPSATFTAETTDLRSAVSWLADSGFCI